MEPRPYYCVDCSSDFALTTLRCACVVHKHNIATYVSVVTIQT